MPELSFPKNTSGMWVSHFHKMANFRRENLSRKNPMQRARNNSPACLPLNFSAFFANVGANINAQVAT